MCPLWISGPHIGTSSIRNSGTKGELKASVGQGVTWCCMIMTALEPKVWGMRTNWAITCCPREHFLDYSRIDGDPIEGNHILRVFLSQNILQKCALRIQEKG